MMKIIIGMCLLLLPFICHGAAFQGVTLTGCAVNSGASAAPTYACTDATHDSANTAITLCEDMQGAVDCDAGAGTQSFCRNAWTLTGTPVFNTSGIEGTYSVSVNNSSEAQAFYKTITTANDYYIFMIVKIVALPETATKVLAKLSSSGTARGWVSITTAGALYVANGTKNATTVGTVSEGSTYYIWWGYTKGSGADGTAYVAFSTNSTKPSSGNNYASVADGDANQQITTVQFGLGSTNPFDIIIDHIRINTSDFGSNPL